MPEFVIIGGGVYGAAVAYWLSRDGAEVRLLEAKSIGNGASAGPGRRGTRANGRDLRELPLARQAHEMWPSLHETLGVPQFFERTGHLLVIEREQDIAAGEARALLQNQFGTETHVLSGDQARAIEPGLSQNILAALHCPLDGASDHTDVTNAFADAARRAGAEISENVKVECLEASNGRVEAVITSDEERIEVGRRLFILANAGVQTLIADRIRLPMWSRTFQVLLTKPWPPLGLRHLIGHASRTLALKSEQGHRIMISGGLPGVWDEATERGTALAASIKSNFENAVAVFPGLEGAEVELADADHLETVAIDAIPVIDVVPGADNAIYAAGWTGHGWAIAPPVTQMLAEWGTTGEIPGPLAPFGHSRFDLPA